ncbi:ABC transporter ATP-binding protein [Magnetovibrio sp.]|uniref:ABC transporter ATP-binding protein n=1 Tax=Magnetovibrio sp. TaxID=2024836 RepID=UPI002F937112
MTKISVVNLWKEYPGQIVLERVNLDLKEKTFCSIVGASGCGKSTFLRILLGQEAQTRGSITIDGAPLPDDPGPDRGIVFQRYSVFPHLTAAQNVAFGLETERAPFLGRLFGAPRKAALDEARTYLEAVGLDHAADKYPAELSGGMQQRLAIAQALVKKPKVLLLDEPFGALDPGIRADMHDLITKLWNDNDMTVFMVTHDLEEGFKLGTRLLVFDKVRIDPDEPGAYGATITYDLPLASKTKAELKDIQNLDRKKKD